MKIFSCFMLSLVLTLEAMGWYSLFSGDYSDSSIGVFIFALMFVCVHGLVSLSVKSRNMQIALYKYKIDMSELKSKASS